jgi:threonine aldolase
MAVLSGVAPRMVQAQGGILTPAIVRRALKPPTLNRAAASLLVIENTHNLAGGRITPAEEMRALISAAHGAGLRVHVDGARLWNAAAATGASLSGLVAGADSVMVTLSKGLCCPAGSLLVSSRERIEGARRVRQQLGGGMRQAGVLAAAGLVALETMIPRLAQDHANARLLADALVGRGGVDLVPPETNIVVTHLEGRTAAEAATALKARGVLASVMDAETLRFVTHNDVNRDDCERAGGVLASVFG